MFLLFVMFIVYVYVCFCYLYGYISVIIMVVLVTLWLLLLMSLSRLLFHTNIYARYMFTVGLATDSRSYFSATTLVIAVPSAIKVFTNITKH